MGRLIKNHWARLVILTGSAIQIAGALEGFFWPKITWDWLTTNFDDVVKPVPILQIINLLFGIFTLAFEWPIKPLAGSFLHKSIEFRLLYIPFIALGAFILYQSLNAGLYYMIGECIYFWALYDGETVCETPWQLPKRRAQKVEA